MQIHLSKLISDRPIAVHFNSEDDAKLFLEEMREHYPRYVRQWHRVIYPDYRYTAEGGVCYCPHLNCASGSMTHASRRYYETDRGYEVVEFEDLLFVDADINEAGMPIELLLA